MVTHASAGNLFRHRFRSPLNRYAYLGFSLMLFFRRGGYE